MKFFTRDWFSGQIDDDAFERLVADYQHHLRKVSPFLPTGALELAGSVPRFDMHASWSRGVRTWWSSPRTRVLDHLSGDRRRRGQRGVAELGMLGFYGRRDRERRPPAPFELAVVVIRFAEVRLTWHPRAFPDDDPPHGEVVFRP